MSESLGLFKRVFKSPEKNKGVSSCGFDVLFAI